MKRKKMLLTIDGLYSYFEIKIERGEYTHKINSLQLCYLVGSTILCDEGWAKMILGIQINEPPEELGYPTIDFTFAGGEIFHFVQEISGLIHHQILLPEVYEGLKN